MPFEAGGFGDVGEQAAARKRTGAAAAGDDLAAGRHGENGACGPRSTQAARHSGRPRLVAIRIRMASAERSRGGLGAWAAGVKS